MIRVAPSPGRPSERLKRNARLQAYLEVQVCRNETACAAQAASGRPPATLPEQGTAKQKKPIALRNQPRQSFSVESPARWSERYLGQSAYPRTKDSRIFSGSGS